jgi:uncharacterized membrane protein
MFFWSWPWHWSLGILGILLAIMIILFIVRVIVRIARNEPWHHHHRDWRGCDTWEDWNGGDTRSTARKILDERYAKGEIDDEEYKRKKENLK